MEEKLLQAAKALPQPQTSFYVIEEMAKVKASKSCGRIIRVGVAVALILCLVTTVFAYGGTRYGLWSGLQSTSYADVEILNRKFSYQFPEMLNGLSFNNMSAAHGAPLGKSYLGALLSPTYVLYNVDYGGALGAEGTQLRVSFGSTEQPQWKYHFCVAEDGSSNYEGVEPGSQYTIEYGGYTLYLYTAHGRPSARWEDQERSLVIDVTGFGEDVSTQEELAEYIKSLLALNG